MRGKAKKPNQKDLTCVEVIPRQLMHEHLGLGSVAGAFSRNALERWWERCAQRPSALLLRRLRQSAPTYRRCRILTWSILDRSRELGQDLSMGFRLPALVLLLLPAHALADANIQSDEADVALLAAACSGCHAKTAEDGFPQIYGLPAVEIREALLSLKADTREGTVMNRMAKGYSDEEIGLLADYLSAQRPAN
jgi:cytochrome subunit of sulfide dehydrogenase